ncbi:MAG: hypothetical protein Q9227_000803 [Pyrenula ochraceoflavens]
MATIRTILVTLVIAALIPSVLGYILRAFARLTGIYLQSRTRARREAIWTRVKTEELEIQSGQRTTSTRTEDEDWEKVESYAAKFAANGGTMADEEWEGIIGFFHPFCNAGGGGERVLWAAIRATQIRWPKALCIVYSGDHDMDRLAMVDRVKDRFNISLHAPTLLFIYLSLRHLVLPSTWPHFTLLGQSLGSIPLAYDAFSLLVPDIFIDTMGYSFSTALCHYLFPRVPTAAYVHYPTISTDMLSSLDDESGSKGVNSGSGSGLRGALKRRYWQLFAKMYGWTGSKIDLVMCNSSWTRGHISSLWKSKNAKSLTSFASVVYPPCAVEDLESKIEVSTDSEYSREPIILYIAQFRGEKNHALILRSFSKYLHSLPNFDGSESKEFPKLVLIGSVRSNTPDETHIYSLRLLAHELRIRDHVSFICDAPYSLIEDHLRRSSIGANGMWNEHFGIGVVEYQAAGLVPVVHNSGGPKLDIVVPYNGEPSGFRAETEDEFANAFRTVLDMSQADRVDMRLRAREVAKKFTEEQFARRWIGEIEELVRMQIARRS